MGGRLREARLQSTGSCIVNLSTAAKKKNYVVRMNQTLVHRRPTDKNKVSF